jgi:hypothetical protein
MISTSANPTAWGFNFFSPPHFAPDGRIGENNALRTKTAHLQTTQADTQAKFAKELFFLPSHQCVFCFF